MYPNRNSHKQDRITKLFLSCVLFFVASCSYENEIDLYFKNTPKTPVTSGLIAHFPLDSGSHDVSGNNTPAILKGKPASEIGIKGLSNTAMQFDGRENYFVAFVGIHDTLTISLWFRTNSTLANQSNKSPGLFDYGIGKFTTNLYHVDGVTAATYLSVKLDSISSPFSESNWLLTPYDEWQHLVVQFANNAKAMVTFNMGKIGTQHYRRIEFPISNINPLAELLYLARDATGQKYFQGSIDEVKVFNRLLTDEEIMSLYQERK